MAAVPADSATAAAAGTGRGGAAFAPVHLFGYQGIARAAFVPVSTLPAVVVLPLVPVYRV